MSVRTVFLRFPAMALQSFATVLILALGSSLAQTQEYAPLESFTSIGTETFMDSGYGRISVEEGSTTPSGIAFFEFRQDGVLVSEAGVPASEPVREGRIHAEVTGAVNTGLAIANPNNTAATIDFYLTGADGVRTAEGSFELGANRQVANFLDEAPFNIGNAVSGTLTFTSTAPVAVIALRGLTNQDGEYLMTTLPVMQMASGAAISSDAVHFPLFVDGDGWATQVVLVNPMDEAITGTVEFLGPGSGATAAAPAVLTLADGRRGSEFPYSIPAGGSQTFITSNPAGALGIGSVRATPASGSVSPSGFAIASISASGKTFSEFSIDAPTAGRAFRLYAESSGTPGQAGSVRTVLVAANTANTASSVSLELTGPDGVQAVPPLTLQIPPSGLLAGFVDEWFDSLPTEFSGVLRVASTADISVAGLRLRTNERGEPKLTAVPPSDETGTPTMENRFFPHIVDSAGWSTQINLYGNGRVTQLGLSENQLSGPVPAESGGLTNLVGLSGASGSHPPALRLAAGVADQESAQTEVAETPPKPNIVVIVADDLGWGQPGFNGGTQVTTPNIDRIADEGVKLTQFYVQPQCAPTRAALLTGRYDWKNGVNTIPDPERTGGLRLDERTIAEALGDVGYANWIVGKWHLGHWLTEHLPQQRGFDHHYGLYTGQIRSFSHTRGASRLDWHRNGRPVVESGYSSFLLADEAAQLIGRHDGANPFFLYLPFNAVHTPHEAPQEYLDLYSGQTKYKQRAMLKAMDDAIGSVLAALESKGILDDTLVMFLSDNGDAPEARTTGQNPYRGRKATYFEGGIRVPAVARWPGKITAGTESDALLHAVDVFPTFAGLAGASTTDGLPLDGLDAWAAIADGAESPRTELVHSPFVLRQGDWKLIERIAHTTRWVSGELHLYNIAEDPYETTNLAETETDRVEEMEDRLDHLAQFSRANDGGVQITDSPVVVFGEEENEAFGTAVQAALTARGSGNTGPTAVLLEAVGDQVKLSFDEALDADAVPPASAFTVVVNPGYNAAEVEDVSVSGRAVFLTLDEAPASTDTVGLTYEVPDTGAIRDADELEAAGVTWITGAVRSAFLSDDATLSALSLSGIDFGTFSSTATSYTADVGNEVATTAVTATANDSEASVSIAPGTEVSLAEGSNEITITVTAEDGLTTKIYTVAVTRAAAASNDATLSALSLSGIEFGTFSSTEASYTADVGNGVATTTVTATANHAGALVSIAPSTEVTLTEGSNAITVTVTAEDGQTTQTYTVTVTRAIPPVVSIEAVSSPVSEGEAAQFLVTRVGSLTDALSVDIRTGSGDIAMSFIPGRRSKVGSFISADDTIVEDDVAVTWTIEENDAYTIAPDAASATVLVEDDDFAKFTVSIDPAEIAEGESATVEVKITNGVTFAADQTIEFDFAGSTATKDTDYSVSPGASILGAGAQRITATVTAVADSNTEADEIVSLGVKHDGKGISRVSLTIKDVTVTPLTAQFLEVPATHDGERTFEFELRFSEEFPLGFKRLRDDAFQVTGGTIRRAGRVVRNSNLRWSIRVLPASDADVVVALPATTDCTATGALCTASGKKLSNSPSATVAGPN